MKNKKPVFIVGLERSGTNIVLNLLRSHPELCSPRGETHEVFMGKSGEALEVRLAKLMRYIPIVMTERRNVLSPGVWRERAPFRPNTQRRIDSILYDEKFRARDSSQNRFKSEGVEYTHEEIARARLLCKNVSGLIFLSREFLRMYPDAVFVALVRNGLAVCEGHMRRGRDLTRVARQYDLGVRQIIHDAGVLPNYHVVRYENLLHNPNQTLIDLCNVAELPLDRLKKIRLETKSVVGPQGLRIALHGATRKELRWYDVRDFSQHFYADANVNQISRLTNKERGTITDICRGTLEHFDYL